MHWYQQFTTIQPTLYLQMLIPTFFGIIIPVYLILSAAVKAGPQISSVIQSITPFITISLSALILKTNFSVLEMEAAVIVTIAVILFQFIFIKEQLQKFFERITTVSKVLGRWPEHHA
jgi:drug/metabolite transporter (DMT)-like permease